MSNKIHQSLCYIYKFKSDYRKVSPGRGFSYTHVYRRLGARPVIVPRGTVPVLSIRGQRPREAICTENKCNICGPAMEPNAAKTTCKACIGNHYSDGLTHTECKTMSIAGCDEIRNDRTENVCQKCLPTYSLQSGLCQISGTVSPGRIILIVCAYIAVWARAKTARRAAVRESQSAGP
jgi:hypothetical protein